VKKCAAIPLGQPKHIRQFSPIKPEFFREFVPVKGTVENQEEMCCLLDFFLGKYLQKVNRKSFVTGISGYLPKSKLSKFLKNFSGPNRNKNFEICILIYLLDEHLQPLNVFR
jgi:hypothetical protein